MRKYNLEQGSQEWLDLRKTKIGASDAPILMGESPYKRTPLMLWKEKVGLSQPPQATPAMNRGNALEAEARKLLKERFNLEVFPAVATHDSRDYMLASYDGLSSDDKVAVEIKCVKKEFHEIAIAGEIPQGFYAQLQHQWYVGTGSIEEMFYVSYSPNSEKDLIILPVIRDEAYIKRMLLAEQKFWDCFINLIPPEAVHDDYTSRSDEDWCRTASNVMVFAGKMKQYKELYEQEKKRLIELSQGANTVGGGVRLTRYTSRGRVNYAKLPQLIGVNLDEYRTKDQESYRISAIKEDNTVSDGSF